MSNNIYKNISTVKIDGFLVIDPSVMMIDKYRVFSNITAYSFRLEKDFKRAIIMDNYFPLKIEDCKYIIQSEKINEEILKIIIKLSENKSIVFSGDISDLFFYDKSSDDLFNNIKTIILIVPKLSTI